MGRELIPLLLLNGWCENVCADILYTGGAITDRKPQVEIGDAVASYVNAVALPPCLAMCQAVSVFDSFPSFCGWNKLVQEYVVTDENGAVIRLRVRPNTGPCG